jgi:crotonobetainyl-CoA:carnitine CoA-transferase CaiB-like acyl-CoA transferase
MPPRFSKAGTAETGGGPAAAPWRGSGSAEQRAPAGEGGGQWGRAAAAVAVVGVGVFVVGVLWHRVRVNKDAARLARRQLAAQSSRDDPHPERAEDAAIPLSALTAARGILYGVRVLDLGTVVAAPGACRVLAELGAEVIKVEPLEGDSSRATFLVFEQPRAHGTLFEQANLNKDSVALDLRSADGAAQLRKLLASCDVLVTNMRPNKLGRLDMHYEALARDFPQLIYAALTAWGQHGPERDYAGFDLGAFWNATGITGLMHEEQAASLYAQVPPGSGDLVTSQALVNAIALALLERQRTGRGQLVATSLFHCGAWCVAPYLWRAAADSAAAAEQPLKPLYASAKPARDPLHTVYRTMDDQHIAVIGHKPTAHLYLSSPQRPAQRRSIGPSRELEPSAPPAPFAGGGALASAAAAAAAAGAAATASPGPAAGADDAAREAGLAALVEALELGPHGGDPEQLYARAAAAIRALPLSDVKVALGKQNVTFTEGRDLLALWSHLEAPGKEHHAHLRESVSEGAVAAFRATVVAAPPGIPDMSHIVAVPYELGGSAAHGVRSRAPRKGEHTEAILRDGWHRRPAVALLPRADRPTAGWRPELRRPNGPLSGCVVVELCDFMSTHTDVALSAAARLMQEQGATVVRLEPRATGGDRARSREPLLYEHYNAGKEVVLVGDLALDGNELVQKLLSGPRNVGVLLTNLPSAKLAQYDLDAAALRRRLPRLVLVHLRSYRTREGPLGAAEHGALGAMYASTGIATCFSGRAPSDYPAPPKHVLELMASFYVSAATSLAWLHRERTGEGQLVSVSYDAIGQWSQMVMTGWVHRNPAIADGLFVPSATFHNCHPVPTYNAHRTKDGFWVQLLGNEAKEHLARTLAALGLRLRGWSLLVWVLATQVLPNTRERLLIVRTRPLWRMLNREIARAVGAMTLDDFCKSARRHDVWFTLVRMPEQLLVSEQAKVNCIFAGMGHGLAVRVTSPVLTRLQDADFDD